MIKKSIKVFVKLLVLMLVLGTSVNVSAQLCNSSFNEDQKSQLILNKKYASQAGSREDIVYVPIKFHLVADSEGNGRLNFETALDQLCELNTVFENYGIKFYMKDGNVNEVNNNTIYNNPASSAGTVKMVAQKNDFGTNAINIFFTDDASTGGLGQTLGYYDFNQDWIVIRKSAAQDEARDHFVLLHEMGHFFSLPHTFLGWDQEPWDGTTVTSVSPGGELNELADGSNCETAGDMICDTPADYNLGFGWDRCNAYDGGCKDLNGELLNPQEENMMGYFLECNEYVFSDDQKAIMDSDYQTSRRSYLRVSYMPTDAEVSGIVELNSPADDATTTFFNGVELSWTPVENASHYWLELTQGIKKTMYIADQSKIFLTDLAADKTYRWRVIPFNEISTCAPSSATWSFRTGEMTTSTSDSDNLEEELIVSPNPIVNNELNIELTNSYLGKFSLNLHDLNGNKVDSKSLIKSSSQFSTKLENLKLENGFYILRLDFGETTIIKKVIVHE